MLLVVATVAGPGRVAGAVTDVADALEYDVETALMDSDDPWQLPGPPVSGDRNRMAHGP